jgi:hypothetical protein
VRIGDVFSTDDVGQMWLQIVGRIDDGDEIASVVLRAALAAVRILERSAAILLFGTRSQSGRKYPNRSHRR